MLFQTEEERRRLLTLDDDESDEGLASSKNSSLFDGIIKILLLLLSPLLYILSLLKMFTGLGSQKEKTYENEKYQEKYSEAKFLTPGFPPSSSSQTSDHKKRGIRKNRDKLISESKTPATMKKNQ